jgi:hypothetical protein
MTKPDPARRYLDRWAHDLGYSDFDTYLQAGGSFLACRDDLLQQQRIIGQMLGYIDNLARPIATEPEPMPRRLRIWPDQLARAEAEVTGEPVDAGNAHAQGAEHASQP